MLIGGLFGTNAANPSGADDASQAIAGVVYEETSQNGAAEASTISPDRPEVMESVLQRIREASRRADAEKKRLIPFSEISYEHYDPSAFYADCERMSGLADQGLEDEVNDMYDRLYDEYLYVDSLLVLAMIEHDRDFYDEYWTDEYSYTYTLQGELWDAFTAAGSYVLGTSCRTAFSAHIGRDMVWLFRYSQPSAVETRPRDERILELQDEYSRLADTAYTEVKYEYLGETWDYDKLCGFSGTALASRDYAGYLEILDELNRQFAELFAPLYIELVTLRNQIAREAGYDNYIDYAYEGVYYRDYSEEDAQRFCDAVKPVAREYYNNIYYADIGYDTDLVSPVYSGEELFSLLGKYLPRLDERLAEPWNVMDQRGLYDIAPSGSGRYAGSYSTCLLYYHAPFLFASLDNSCTGLYTITHEYGHCCDYLFSPKTNILTQSDSLDLSEIHSNAMQALFTIFYDEIFTDGADIAEYTVLCDLIENVVDGCLFDEFQRRVYACPGELTAKKLNEIYIALCAEYGDYSDLAWNSDWCFVPHNFERPLYYISYAVSAIPALQIWDMAQADPQQAVDTYLDVLEHGSFAEEYCSVLRDTGLRLFTEKNAAGDICRPVLARLEELVYNY